VGIQTYAIVVVAAVTVMGEVVAARWRDFASDSIAERLCAAVSVIGRAVPCLGIAAHGVRRDRHGNQKAEPTRGSHGHTSHPVPSSTLPSLLLSLPSQISTAPPLVFGLFGSESHASPRPS